MLRLLKAAGVGFILCMMFGQSVTAEPLDGSSRRDAWRQALDRREFVFPSRHVGVFASLRHFTADGEVHVVYDPKKKRALKFRFFHDDREILSLSGHDRTAFTSFENALYFADYPPDSTGCTLAAYDLASGKKLWETELHHSKPHGHSAYSNVVTIRLSNAREIEDGVAGAAIIVTGSESYCDYVEVLDRQTGDSLAIKEYRIGFGPPPPAGGAFGGERR